MSYDLDALRDEHDRERVGVLLYRMLGEIVLAIAPVYPPAIYSSAGAWDQASLTDLLHDWITTRLLRGDLQAMLTSAASVGSLKAQLVTSLRQLIINNRQRDSAINLYLRSAALLSHEDTFAAVGQGTTAHRQWTLAADPYADPSPLALSALIALAYQLSDDQLQVIRYGPQSLKSSPILREPQLRRLLAHLLAGAQGTLDVARIAEVLQHRFSLLRQPSAALADELDSGAIPVELQVEASLAARAVLEQLRIEDIEALRALQDADWVVSRAARQHGCSEGRIAGARDRVAATVAELAATEQEATQILRILLESLFQ